MLLNSIETIAKAVNLPIPKQTGFLREYLVGFTLETVLLR
jgi:hypothetical protein